MRHLVSVACLLGVAGCATRMTSQDARDAVHMQVYHRYFSEYHDPFGGDIFFVDEPEAMIRELRERFGTARFESAKFCVFDKQLGRPVDIRTRKPGVELRFDRMEIRRARASLVFSWFASPIGAQNYEVELHFVAGVWTISKWEIGLTS
jgi:hypothetical protein